MHHRPERYKLWHMVETFPAILGTVISGGVEEIGEDRE